MKKFKFIILLFALLGMGLYLYNNCDIGVTASIHGNITSPESSGPSGGFSADKGTVFTASYSSNVVDGTLQLFVENSKGEIVNEFPVNSKSSEEITFDTYDNYTLRASWTDDFIGNFDVKIK